MCKINQEIFFLKMCSDRKSKKLLFIIYFPKLLIKLIKVTYDIFYSYNQNNVLFFIVLKSTISSFVMYLYNFFAYSDYYILNMILQKKKNYFFNLKHFNLKKYKNPDFLLKTNKAVIFLTCTSCI